ncbi:MAG: hypothetical protein C4K49_10725 [Candidatus Thorarchaeota archaeon]|nr:MAG: hypothetical protein C4K49_10725 [Candidatus Thorarchaeota archaeon]
MKAKVVCNKCAYLMVVKGVAPFCLAGAYFVDSELCRKVDVKGIKVAAKVNKSMNCKKKKRISLKANAFHRWLKTDLKRKGLQYAGRDLSAYKCVTLEKKYVGQLSRDSGSLELGEKALLAGAGSSTGAGGVVSADEVGG